MRLIGKTVGLAVAVVLSAASPAVAHDRPVEAVNKQVVLDFYKALNDADATGTTKQRIQSIAEKYVSPDYIQHAAAFADLPGGGTARDKLVRMFQTMPPMPPLPAPKTISVMADGDLVMMLTARDMPDPATGRMQSAYVFNMFRVKGGRLVEHWDVGTPTMPAPGRAMPSGVPDVPKKP